MGHRPGCRGPSRAQQHGHAQRAATVLLACALLTLLPGQARACDPNCDVFLAVVVGVPSALGTTVIAPLVGRALDSRDRPPYWQAVGAAAAASAAGVLLATAVSDGTHDVTRSDVVQMAALPALLGSAATWLVHRQASRGAPTRSRAPHEGAGHRVDALLGPRSAGLRFRF